jgi:hypothetical protein
MLQDPRALTFLDRLEQELQQADPAGRKVTKNA